MFLPSVHQHNMLPPPQGKPYCWKLGQPFEWECFFHTEKQHWQRAGSCLLSLLILRVALSVQRLTRDWHREKMPIGLALGELSTQTWATVALGPCELCGTD